MTPESPAAHRLDRHRTWFNRTLAAAAVLGLVVTIIGFIVMSLAPDICFGDHDPNRVCHLSRSGRRLFSCVPWITYGTVILSALWTAPRLIRAQRSPLWGLPIGLGLGTVVAVATYWGAFLL